MACAPGRPWRARACPWRGLLGACGPLGRSLAGQLGPQVPASVRGCRPGSRKLRQAPSRPPQTLTGYPTGPRRLKQAPGGFQKPPEAPRHGKTQIRLNFKEELLRAPHCSKKAAGRPPKAHSVQKLGHTYPQKFVAGAWRKPGRNLRYRRQVRFRARLSSKQTSVRVAPPNVPSQGLG